MSFPQIFRSWNSTTSSLDFPCIDLEASPLAVVHNICAWSNNSSNQRTSAGDKCLSVEHEVCCLNCEENGARNPSCGATMSWTNYLRGKRVKNYETLLQSLTEMTVTQFLLNILYTIEVTAIFNVEIQEYQTKIFCQCGFRLHHCFNKWSNRSLRDTPMTQCYFGAVTAATARLALMEIRVHRLTRLVISSVQIAFHFGIVSACVLLFLCSQSRRKPVM